ncbi:Osmotin thaumatin-like protein [Lactarius quietus]|nr:Osmotin thaumatin-like protein [Lactarius quietus]
MFRHSGSLLPPTMKVYIPLLLSASPFLTTTMARTISVTNNCSYTTWPALFTASDKAPGQPTGWLAAPSSEVSFTVPDDWSGFIWGRRDCNFTTNPGANSCLDGGCPGGLLCNGLVGRFKVLTTSSWQAHIFQGQSPVTTATFNLSTDTSGVPDYYSVSLTNGFNMPMRVNNTNPKCTVSECSADLGANCPLPLQEPYNPTGFPSGCNSACAAGLATDPNNDPNCCTGKYTYPGSCVPPGVQYYSYFKTNCPYAYVYKWDMVDGSPLFLCPSGPQVDYAVTFCPQKN